MSQDAEYQNLARQFMELWQDRMNSLLQDGEYVRLLLKMLQSAPVSANSGSASKGDPYASFFRASQTGGTTAASRAGDAALASVERRLAEIERRLAALEAGVKPKRAGKPVAKATHRPRTGTGNRNRSKK